MNMEFLTIFDLQDRLGQARLAGAWGQYILTANVFHDGLTITVPQGKIEAGQNTLRTILADAFIPASNKQEDDMVRFADGHHLPVYWDEDDTDAKPWPFDLRPLLRDIALLTEKTDKNAINQAVLNISESPASPKITAFFSFKGGVGRTLHLTAFAHALAKATKSDFVSPKILLIDADIEAPGITLWTRDILSDPQYSFFDLLGDALEGVNIASERAARKIQSLRLPFGNASSSYCYFLPLFRKEIQLFRPPVLPERLVLGGENPWIMGDLLIELGKQLKLDHILVDLRAGLTELSSPLFVDPRVNRVLVSTTSMQSVEGTVWALQSLASFAKLFSHEQALYADSTQVLLGFIPRDINPDIPQTTISQFEECLQQLVPEKAEPDLLDLPSWIIKSNYDESLLGLRDFSDALEKMEASQTIQEACERLLSKVLVKSSIDETSKTTINNTTKTNNNDLLAQCLEGLIFADDQQENDFLVIDAYKRLASNFLGQIPSAVIMGAKGSGKTFLFKILATFGGWSAFCDHFSLNAEYDSSIIPVFWTQNAIKTRDSVFQQQINKVTHFNRTWSKENAQNLESKIKNIFGTPTKKTDSAWRENWFECFCSFFGIASKNGQSWEELFKKASVTNNKPIVLLFDGLEDLFQSWLRYKDEEGIPPLRILLQEIIRDMPSLSTNNIGILLLIRKDLVQSAITQNFGQFASIYKKYELRWSKEEALRLVGWVLQKCDMQQYRNNLTEREWEEADFEVMEKMLYPLWGKKLGRESSKEAYTVNWVFSAISDFKGNIQARDILRLLFTTATVQKNKPFFDDRLLSPSAFRDALRPCGEKKIEEIEEEITILKGELAKLKSARPSSILPLSQEDIQHLSLENISIFEQFGLLFRDGDDYYLPEMYRQGLHLDFKPEANKARPRVITLMRKALAQAGIST